MKTRVRLALGEPHPDMGQLISDYQDGLATPDQAGMVERHLLECELCRAFYGGLQEARALISDLPTRRPDPEQLEASFHAVLRRLGRRRRN